MHYINIRTNNRTCIEYTRTPKHDTYIVYALFFFFPFFVSVELSTLKEIFFCSVKLRWYGWLLSVDDWHYPTMSGVFLSFSSYTLASNLFVCISVSISHALPLIYACICECCGVDERCFLFDILFSTSTTHWHRNLISMSNLFERQSLAITRKTLQCASDGTAQEVQNSREWNTEKIETCNNKNGKNKEEYPHHHQHNNNKIGEQTTKMDKRQGQRTFYWIKGS